MTPPLAIDLDRVLGDTRPLWDEFLADAARRFDSIARLDPAALPADRAAAADRLDEWALAGVGDWRGALERFAEERAPVFFRPDAEVTTALRELAALGAPLGAFSDAPEPLARVALDHLGGARRIQIVEAGAGARERLVQRLGANARVVAEREDLVRISRDARAQASR
jgi:phosphoglycolate phosphatase-like HAD superfamily hydrolase